MQQPSTSLIYWLNIVLGEREDRRKNGPNHKIALALHKYTCNLGSRPKPVQQDFDNK
jgi:hypothetical protein